ncbi:hypothetical protein [Clostridium fessum]|uniref:hypothetical protein n=1 Tax=Clostridium fessum TaxID=2126740 RepID=UPI0022DF5747|nr:hypothetical protein [Clostridium fessum]
MISRAKKYVAVLLAFVCVCMLFSPQTAYAAEDSSQHETVKVGFFAMDGYHVMDEEGNRSGYGYDFLRLMARYWDVDCNGVQREHNKKLNNGLPILHKVPPKRDYGRYFCIMAEKGGTSHGGLTEKLSPFFHAKKQEVNAYGR